MNERSDIPEEDAEYCRRQIALGDEDLFLSLGYARDDDRARLTALFAFQIELRRIPFLVSEPPLGEIRLQWWREALTEAVAGKAAPAHPVVSLMAATGAVNVNSRDLAERLIDARARLLYQPEFFSLEDLQKFLREAETPLVTLLLGDKNAAVEKLGDAYALARFAPSLAPKLADDAATAALRLHEEIAKDVSLSAADAGRVAFLALTDGYAARADGRGWPVMKRIALVRAVLTGRL